MADQNKYLYLLGRVEVLKRDRAYIQGRLDTMEEINQEDVEQLKYLEAKLEEYNLSH